MIDYGVVTTPKECTLPERLMQLEEGVVELIDTYKPDNISIEELFFSKNVTTGIPVAEARGVILLTAVKNSARKCTNTRPIRSNKRSPAMAERTKYKCSTWCRPCCA